MPSLSPRQFPLYHGSAHHFRPGDAVEPTDRLYTLEPVAYASPDRQIAANIAQARINKGADRSNPGQTALFGPIYEVEHLSERPEVRSSGSHIDAKGFRVKKLAGYVSHEGEAL